MINSLPTIVPLLCHLPGSAHTVVKMGGSTIIPSSTTTLNEFILYHILEGLGEKTPQSTTYTKLTSNFCNTRIFPPSQYTALGAHELNSWDGHIDARNFQEHIDKQVFPKEGCDLPRSHKPIVWITALSQSCTIQGRSAPSFPHRTAHLGYQWYQGSHLH